MKKTIRLTLIILILLFTWFNSAHIHASPNKALIDYSKSLIANSSIIWVPDNHTTIQEAINEAKEGDTIFVRANTYYERVVIVNKTLSLVGENTNNTIIDGNKTEAIVFLILYSNIVLRNFTIQNAAKGIQLFHSHNTNLTGNIVANNQYGIYSSYSSNNIFTSNNISNNGNGINLWSSSYNSFTRNTFSSNNQYGIYSSHSSNNIFTSNNISNNGNGINLWKSDSNIFTSNNISNNGNGISLDSSSYNSFTRNTFSSNNQYGIYLYHSSNNVVSGNTVLNSSHGVYIIDSDNNVLSSNNALNNQYGINLNYSYNNILTGNTITNNTYGINSNSSSNNEILHNNFINNTEPANNIDSINSWDNGAEGNYWSNYNGLDENEDGIGDTPYPLEENNQDNHPLMAMFQQFSILIENKTYLIDAVCNSTISDFQLRSDLNNRTNVISFKVNGTGFCRISIPHALIEPPFTVRVDDNPPLHFKKVYANGTYTWLYFAYESSEHEITIMHTPPSEQLLLFQWAIFALAIITVILFSISIYYYRLFKKKKEVIETYEREVGSFPVSHEERARMRFIKDVIEREEKIEKFKRKYGIKIQPANTLEDLMKKLGVKKES